MKTQSQILEEIAQCCPSLEDQIAEIVKRENHTSEQTKAIHNTWCGLLFWRRTSVEEMVNAYVGN
jgi:23S rRNA maturation mini-RNase III